MFLKCSHVLKSEKAEFSTLPIDRNLIWDIRAVQTEKVLAFLKKAKKTRQQPPSSFPKRFGIHILHLQILRYSDLKI